MEGEDNSRKNKEVTCESAGVPGMSSYSKEEHEQSTDEPVKMENVLEEEAAATAIEKNDMADTFEEKPQIVSLNVKEKEVNQMDVSVEKEKSKPCNYKRSSGSDECGKKEAANVDNDRLEAESLTKDETKQDTEYNTAKQSQSSPQLPEVAIFDKETKNIPGNLLSPPMSETRIDEAKGSSSPKSESRECPISTNETISKTVIETLKSSTLDGKSSPGPAQSINVLANGSIPNSGKPLMAAMNKKLNKPPARVTRPRKKKALVAMYESEISANKIGIKLCIKKSDTSTGLSPPMPAPMTMKTATTSNQTTPKVNNRKRPRKAKPKARLDSDDSECETRRKKDRSTNNNGEKQRKVSFSGVDGKGALAECNEPIEQGEWGSSLPEDVLFKIFQMVVDKEGCLPTLFRLGRVCSLWRRVSLFPMLWKSLDLSTWIKEKYRTEFKLKWFVDNRCSSCTELNISNWKVSDINCFLMKLSKGCPNLRGITLSGWKNFTSDHLTFLVNNLKKLERLDLSSINVEMNASKSAVGLQSLCSALQTMNGRLTHLYLAHNRLAGIPQMVTVLSTSCPNLVLLDLSNVTTQALSHAVLHIEKLQHGCQKLKVLRVTNSHVIFNSTTMQEMMNSPGFPELEELSVAFPQTAVVDEDLQRILKTSSKLKLLDIRGCVRLTHESLIRLPAWDIKHLFLSGCSVTRDVGSGLDLIASKWAHSLIELDLAWANVQQPLDNALRALSEKGSESPLAHLNLCGSSVSDEAVKDILSNCVNMSSINLSSCRGLPRGVKRLMQGPQELQELRDVLKVEMKVKLPSQLKREDEKHNESQVCAVEENSISGNSIDGSCRNEAATISGKNQSN